MKHYRWISLLLVFFLLAAGNPGTVDAQSSDSVYIPETGHWIWGEFLHTYNSVADPLVYFGYPITDNFADTETGQQVQYFQRALFMLEETDGEEQVIIAPLGELLHEDGAQLADIPNDGPTCRKFASGFSVCYAFLQFYDAYDGDTWFGEPISEVEVADGHYVQYFRNVRMEWWPDKPSGQKVNLSDLGRIYFDKVIAKPELLKSSPSEAVVSKQVNPSVNVFALKSLIGAGEQQTVFVIVQDQTLKPLSGAEVGMTVYYPDGEKEYYRMSESNEFGISQLTFPVEDYEPRSIVNVEVEANVRGEKAKGKTWFRLWW